MASVFKSSLLPMPIQNSTLKHLKYSLGTNKQTNKKKERETNKQTKQRRKYFFQFPSFPFFFFPCRSVISIPYPIQN